MSHDSGPGINSEGGRSKSVSPMIRALLIPILISVAAFKFFFLLHGKWLVITRLGDEFFDQRQGPIFPPLGACRVE